MLRASMVIHKHWIPGLALISLLIGVAMPFTLAEPPEHTGLSACQAYGRKQFLQPGKTLTLRAQDLTEDKYEAKVGRQFISTVLSGTAVLQGEHDYAPQQARFVCLLENDRTPVFFRLDQREARDPIASCWDQFQPAEWGVLQTCLKNALHQAESDLTATEAKAALNTRNSLAPQQALTSLKQSSQQWRDYRTQECARRQDQVAGRNHPDVGEMTCKIQKTRERIQDFHFDD